MTTIMIVLLYGLDHPERADYRGYLDWVGQQIKEYSPNQVILCGGFTDPKQPTISEASSVQTYLEESLPDREWIREELSLTTFQNLAHAQQTLELSGLHADQYFILSDRARQAKVLWIGLAQLLHLPTAEIYTQLQRYISQQDYALPFTCQTITFLNYPYTTQVNDLLRQTFSALMEVALLFDPSLEKIADQQRRQDFGLDT
jgi:lysine/ornithine N-monooxygenase